MKIRKGFVSNSSSCSFLIYGTDVDKKTYDRVDEGKIIFKDKRIQTYCYSDADSYYVGASWDSIHDDETGLQFKQTIDAELSKALGEEIIGGTYKESWCNS